MQEMTDEANELKLLFEKDEQFDAALHAEQPSK